MIDVDRDIELINVLGSLVLLVGFPALGAIFAESLGRSSGVGALAGWTVTIGLIWAAAGILEWPPSLAMIVPVGVGIYPAIGAEILRSKHRTGALGVIISLILWFPAQFFIIWILDLGIELRLKYDPQFHFDHPVSELIWAIILLGPGAIALTVCAMVPVRAPRRRPDAF